MLLCSLLTVVNSVWNLRMHLNGIVTVKIPEIIVWMVDIAFVSSEMIILKLFGYFMARRPIRFVNGMLLKTQ